MKKRNVTRSGCCIRCAWSPVILGGICAAVVILTAVIVTTIVFTGSDNGQSTSSSISVADLTDDACPGPGLVAANSGTYSHYVQIMYTYSGDSINCTIAEGVNSAASAVVGVGTNRMMLSVGESLELGSRVLRQLRARGRVITETILANDAIDMDQIAKDVDDSVDDGSLREQLDEKAPAVTFSGGNDDEIESISVTTGTITTPRSEDQIPSPSASPATDPTPISRRDGRCSPNVCAPGLERLAILSRTTMKLACFNH